MGTRSNIYIETEPGTYLGTYCHYDGYPKHMFPTLSQMKRDELLAHILIGMTQGGLRGIYDNQTTEYLGDFSSPCILTNPVVDAGWGPEFIYVKRFDGRVMWRHEDKPEWKFEE
tara:strand:- start:60 stop:401 length:342 start_codon:yes stop_codon:yes gene_type:complete